VLALIVFHGEVSFADAIKIRTRQTARADTDLGLVAVSDLPKTVAPFGKRLLVRGVEEGAVHADPLILL
jgi:hypothetical protein